MVIGLASIRGRTAGVRPQVRDWVLLAGFENRTGESLFDGTLQYALQRELGNSYFVNVVPRERAEDALRLMRKTPERLVGSGQREGSGRRCRQRQEEGPEQTRTEAQTSEELKYVLQRRLFEEADDESDAVTACCWRRGGWRARLPHPP